MDAEKPDGHVAEGGGPPAETPGYSTRSLTELPRSTFLDAGALSGLLGCHRKTVNRMARRGELPAPFRFNGRWGWTAGAITDHLQARQEAALKPAARRDARIRALSP
jgi:predicted DNA-binding transcriptional regulator AlpA